ncbi:MAG: hypothetical protein V3W04_03825 [Gammaproteobacteria bacterium]
MSCLQLTVPAQTTTVEKFSARAISDWIESLPQLNQVKSIASIVEKSKAINRQTLPAELRKDILATLQSGFIHFNRHLSHKDFQKDNELRINARCFWQEQSFGYKIIVNELNADKKSSSGTLLMAAIAGALDALDHYSLYYYGEYQRLPLLLWLEAIQIYRFAVNMGIDLEKPPSRKSGALSINEIFQTMVLLRISDPYQLQSGAVWVLHKYFQKLSTTSHIINSGESLRVLQNPLLIDKADSLTEYDLLIDINPLIDQIGDDYNRIIINKQHDLGTFIKQLNLEGFAHTLKRVQTTWSSKVDRKNDRVEAHQRFEAVIGLQACCQVVQSQQPTDEVIEDSETEHIEISSTVNKTSWNNYPTTYPCNSFNRNSGGIALRFDFAAKDSLYVGQLLALHHPDTPRSEGWVVGVVRWLTLHNNPQTIELGIQYLSRNAKPVSLSKKTGTTKASLALACRQKQGDQPVTTLLAPKGFYADQAGLELDSDDGSILITCQTLLESTPAFERFIYQTASKIAQISHANQLADPVS